MWLHLLLFNNNNNKVPGRKITEEPQGTINSSHLNRKLQLRCCGDGSNHQSHLKCSPKELATVVCALRTIVTTCTKNNHCHHSRLLAKVLWWKTAGLRAASVMKLEATIILMTSSVFEEGSLSWVFLKLRNRDGYKHPYWHTFRT